MNTPTRVEAPLDLDKMKVDKFAGLTLSDYREAADFAKIVSHAKSGIPEFLRGNAADCLIVITQALRWNLEPVWVMQNSYVTKNGGIINYNNFVFGAVLNASGVLKGRPKYTYAGQGDHLTCTVTAEFKDGSVGTVSTPPLKDCRKHSPLWTQDPQQQLGYYAIRSFARRYVPELLGGVYLKDELENEGMEVTQDAPRQPRQPPKSIKDGLDDLVGKSKAEQLKAAGLADEEIDEALEDMGEYAESDDESVPNENVPKDNIGTRG